MNFGNQGKPWVKIRGRQKEAPAKRSMSRGNFVRAAVIAGVMMLPVSPASAQLNSNVIQGVVVDDQGAPVEGAALYVGKQVAYTDSSGRFLVRFSKRGSFPLRLAREDFFTNGVYQVVSAPAQVQAESEDSVTDVRIVVRRVPPPQAKLYNQ
jgi:hypothetical protein